jgi:RNA polymerase sigma-70 factor (ECF subfamily)
MQPDEQRLTRIWLDHKVAVEKFIRRRVGPDSAEDCLQETFSIAWRKLDAVPVNDPLPWLFTTARNVLRNRLRADARADAIPLRMAAQPDLNSDFTDEVVAQLRLGAAWSRLSASDQEVLALVAWDGLTGDQAAAVLGITRNAFAVRLMRARTRLKTAMEEPTGTNDERSLRTAAVN